MLGKTKFEVLGRMFFEMETVQLRLLSRSHNSLRCKVDKGVGLEFIHNLVMNVPFPKKAYTEGRSAFALPGTNGLLSQSDVLDALYPYAKTSLVAKLVSMDVSSPKVDKEHLDSLIEEILFCPLNNPYMTSLFSTMSKDRDTLVTLQDLFFEPSMLGGKALVEYFNSTVVMSEPFHLLCNTIKVIVRELFEEV